MKGGREGVSATSVDHVQVAIPPGGEERARAFYGGLLGLEEMEKPEGLRARGGVWFRTGSVALHLGVDQSLRPATKAHVAFGVLDLDAVRQRLQTAGHPTREEAPLDGHRRFYCDDPFGNRVEVLGPA